ncbi:MAG: hypothetical protein KME10_21875 [Plectolyngbya sp. WJT66-NPBG17]|jgi:hypothetical protein|nr:hypothetical protein [Plectolyngbya sp. WJT66-NPBG17]MBW4528443.1 hypothetical protein [Phormidium tanganyikae FI6-MK23]
MVTWLEDGSTVMLGLYGAGDIVGQYLSKIDPYQIERLPEIEATPVSLDDWFPDRLSPHASAAS